MRNPSSILFVTHTLNIGGAAKMMKYAAVAAKANFTHVEMLAITDSNLSDRGCDNIRQICLGVTPLPKILWQFKAIFELRKILKQHQAKYICTFVTQVALITKIASFGLNKVIISAERGDPYTLSWLWKRIARWVYKNSDFAFFQLKGAQTFYGESVCNKSFVIPNPILKKNLTEKRVSNKIKKTIVSMGRFVPEKLFDVLIRSFADVHRKHPEYTLILYGNGPLLQDYQTLVEELKIQEYVFFPGYISDVESAIRNEGIFVLSSRFEGIPNTLIEAMSVGIPCIATDCTPGGPRFLTKNGENGLLIPVNDVKSMTNAILSLIENPNLYEQLSVKSLEVWDTLKEENIRAMYHQAFGAIRDRVEKNQ